MAVKASEDFIEIPTYVLGPEDPNPPFQRKGYWSIYPYTMMDDIGEKATPVRYRAQMLENEYLRVIVLPQLGGHLYSAQDKATGREIFYRNNVVKPGLIALRGAWISGGIEFNFPKGHTVTTVSPVDNRIVKDKDGSVTAWIGNVEKRFRMSWQVGIRLYPESALIETEIRLANRTSLPHPHYFWANAAVPARFGMQMVYPCTRVRTLGAYYDWPVHEGRHMATYDAYDTANDVFALNGWEDFFGVYYPDWDFGVAHVAPVQDCFGKKMFTWGTSEEGRGWASILSDSDGPYCEIQSGRFVDQQTWRMLAPHHSVQWTECWYAIKGTGGFQWATKDAAARLERVPGGVEIALLVTRPAPGATIRLLAGARVVHEAQADLSPDQPRREVVKKAPAGPLTLSVEDADGEELIRYQEAQQPRTIPLRTAPEPADPPTLSDVLRRAKREEEQGDFAAARRAYEQALESDANCLIATRARGRLAIGSRPEQAVRYLDKAAALSPGDAEVAYYLGVALSRAGRAEEAAAPLWQAAQEPEFAHAARVELGTLALRREDWVGAIEHFATAGELTVDGVRTRCLLAMALRRAGLPQQAMEEMKELESSPLDRLGLMETYFCALALDKDPQATKAIEALVKLLPPEADNWLELALDYADCGLYPEATAVLEEGAARIGRVAAHPILHYLLASWLHLQGEEEKAAEARATASEASPKLVFPYQWEVEAALRDAIAANPDEARAHYYLGTLLYSQDRCEEGLAAWEAAAQAGMGDFHVLFRDLGYGSRDCKHDLATAEQWLRKAIAPQPDDQRPYLELDEVLRARQADPAERLTALDSAGPDAQRRTSIAAAQIDACVDLGEWDRALDLLRRRSFHRWEGEFGMRRLWVSANLGRGAARFDAGDAKGAAEDFEGALSYPANLHIGRHAKKLDAHAHWCAGVAWEARGDAAKAKEHWEEAATEVEPPSHQLASHYGVSAPELVVFRALSLRKLGRAEEAEKLLTDLVEKLQAHAPADDARAQYELGLALKAQGKAKEAEAALRRALELYPWRPEAKRLLTSEVIL